MSLHPTKDPCRIESDSEDEKDGRKKVPITTRSATTKVTTKTLPTKTPDWDASPNTQRANKEQPLTKRPTSSNESERPDLATRISSSSSSGSSSKLTTTHEPMASATTTGSSPTSPGAADSSDFNPIALIQEDLKAFVYMYIPKEYPSFVQCTLRRDKDGVQGGFFPTFYLQAERPGDGKKFFLLAARKLAKVKRQSEYIIATSAANLSEKSGGEDYVGKLRGVNVSGTEYTLFDNGLSPNKVSNNRRLNDPTGLRRELVGIVYNTNILGFKGPRQMTAVIPKLDHGIRPGKDENGILEQWRDRRFGYLMQLRNKTPTYNEETRTYVLRFTGNRVAQPSVKNFQIVLENENHEEEVAMQFGRVQDDIFTCDFRYPLSAIQAFGIALSSFESRLARE